jgi:hypothetical protein
VPGQGSEDSKNKTWSTHVLLLSEKNVGDEFAQRASSKRSSRIQTKHEKPKLGMMPSPRRNQ